MKICSRCKISKDYNEFYTNKNKYISACKQCYNNDRKQKYLKNQHKNNPIQIEKRKQYAIANRKRKAEYDKIYRTNNKQRIALNKKIWENKNKNNVLYKIKKNLRRRIHHVLKDNYKSDHTMNLLGCTIEYFLQYVEDQFDDNMTWDNYGLYGWHIDHIIPCYKFDLSDPEQQKLCFHYSNQRPLWAKDNLSRPKL